MSKLVLGYCLKTKNDLILQARWLMIEEVHMNIFCGSLQLPYILWAKAVIANVLNFLSRMSTMKTAWRGDSTDLGQTKQNKQTKKGSFSSYSHLPQMSLSSAHWFPPRTPLVSSLGQNSLQISKKAFLKKETVSRK